MGSGVPLAEREHGPYPSTSRRPEPVELCQACSQHFGVGMRWPCGNAGNAGTT
ncbi:hypothetical protein STSO111631_20220 [Stackebrandtia soli]